MASYPSSSSFNAWNHVPSSSNFNGNPSCSCGNSLVPVASSSASATEIAMRHNPGISIEWTLEEQAVLEEGLVRFGASESNVTLYASIALQLQNKTVRDVALRVLWMKNNKENSKRRKDDLKLTKKSKNRKEKVSGRPATSFRRAARPNVSSHAPGMAMMNNNDGMPYKAIGGPIGTLLEQNALAFNQISKNLASQKHEENIKLFCQTRENINKIMKYFNDSTDLMRQMPPLPVKLDELDVMEEMANGQLDTSMFLGMDFAPLDASLLPGTDFTPLECGIHLRA